MNPYSDPFVPQQFTLLTPGSFSLQPTQSHDTINHDSQWTPIWSDVFKMAEEARMKQEIQKYQEEQALRSWINLQKCQSRNLIHVQPEKEMSCNVIELEKAAAASVKENTKWAIV